MMTDLAVDVRCLAISNSKNILIVNNEETCKEIIIDHAAEFVPLKNKATSEDSYDGGIPIVSTAFSCCGNLFLCCSHKSLSVWSTQDWKLVCKKTVQRSISKVIFTPKSESVIVADKSGDVYIHSLKDFEKPGDLILGHVSMLLDILVTEDERFIITCDRDEKIRVSLFPNSYNIQSYCLGHDDFVTSINILPTDNQLLLSSGGDGTLRLWEFEMGKEILCHSLKNDSNICFEDTLPVVFKVALLKINDNKTLVCSLVHKTNGIWVHSIKHAPVLSLDFVHIVQLDHEPFCLQSLQICHKLWLFQLHNEESLLCFNVNSENVEELSNDNIKHVRSIIQKYIKLTEINTLQEKQVNSLCKRKFDNEETYYKRKQERMDAEKTKHKVN